MHSIRDLAKGWRSNPPSRLRRPLTATLLAIALTVTMSASALSRAPASASGGPGYLDASLSAQARVNDLLGRMTLPEKIGQMVQIEATQVTDTTSACTSQASSNSTSRLPAPCSVNNATFA